MQLCWTLGNAIRKAGRMTLVSRAFGLAVAACLLAGCGNDVSWRQKVTVTVATPNGEVSGASVMKVSWSGGIPFIVGDARGGGFKLTGEAPVVKLGNGHFLFALLKGMDSKLLYQFRNKDGRGAGMKDNSRAILGLKEPLILPSEAYPVLVTFADINDPASVQRVDPDDLAATFRPRLRAFLDHACDHRRAGDQGPGGGGVGVDQF
jgi:hypothetical protein